jgi:hypothetical protein
MTDTSSRPIVNVAAAASPVQPIVNMAKASSATRPLNSSSML